MYLEETFIPGSTFASKMKVLKPKSAALKYFTPRRRPRRRQDNKLFVLIATQQRISNRKQCIFSYILLPIHDKKIIKYTVVMDSSEVNNATAGSFCNMTNKLT